MRWSQFSPHWAWNAKKTIPAGSGFEDMNYFVLVVTHIQLTSGRIDSRYEHNYDIRLFRLYIKTFNHILIVHPSWKPSDISADAYLDIGNRIENCFGDGFVVFFVLGCSQTNATTWLETMWSICNWWMNYVLSSWTPVAMQSYNPSSVGSLEKDV
jgi:hypothetical protein